MPYTVSATIHSSEKMLSQLTKNISRSNIAVDLGTANTRVYNTLHDEVIEKPSATGLLTGKSSNEYFQYINDRVSTKPLRGGVIVDLRNATHLLKPLVKKSRKLFFSPIALASAPTGATEKERDLLRTALIDAGALHVSIIPEIWAAAIGAGIDMTLPNAQLLVDIGDGVTDMAVFRGGRIVYWSSVINGAIQTLNYWNGKKCWWENLVWPKLALSSH